MFYIGHMSSLYPRFHDTHKGKKHEAVILMKNASVREKRIKKRETVKTVLTAVPRAWAGRRGTGREGGDGSKSSFECSLT